MTYGIVGYLGHGISILSGWNTLPLGAGGLVTGLHIANDSSVVCRTDVGNIYRWSGKTTDYADPTKKWLPLLNYASLGSSVTTGQNLGGWDHVLAPGTSTTHLAIFADMGGSQTLSKLWYSTDSGGSWTASNISFTNAMTNSNGNLRRPYYKLAIDPANANVAYCGVPLNSGNTAGVYTSLNQAGGSTLATWASVKTSGATPIPGVASFTYNGSTLTDVLSCGIAIDPSLGTTPISGQTVTKHIILPVGGVGIYESKDGGVTFTEIAATHFGTTAFQVLYGGFNGGGVYYCIVQSSVTGVFGVWRYVTGAPGTWLNITPASYVLIGNFVPGGVFLIINPNVSNGYLSATGANGIGAGFTSANANTGTPTWVGLTGSQTPNLLAKSYDVPWVNFVFGQTVANEFCDASSAVVDPNGNCFWGGNQSLFYLGTSNTDATPNGLPSYSASLPFTLNWWSMGRGQEATVAQDVLVPPGGTFPIIACQDLGGVMRGTFTTYPNQVFDQFQEYSGNSLEYAASDPSFIVAKITGQIGNANGTTDAPAYSTNYGADGSWVSAGSGVASLYAGGLIMSGGQIVAVDHDHWVCAVQGSGSQAYQPAFTTNGTTSATWTLCTGLPSANYFNESWSNGNCLKPLAVGYGADLNTVWALLISIGGTSATIYRSTDKGANFSSIITWTSSASVGGPILLSVPGFTGELWATARYTGGVAAQLGMWHITNANTATASKTQITLPVDADLPIALTLGAPSSPGGYPTLYYVGTQSGSGGTAPHYLYQGVWNGTSVTWTRFGSTGTQNDLPVSCQLAGIQALRGDPNVYQRLYVASNQSGYAYYNP